MACALSRASVPAAARLASLAGSAARCSRLPPNCGRSQAADRRSVTMAATGSGSAAPTPGPGAALKAAVRRGDPLFGLFLNASSPLIAEQLAHLPGYDYMLVDIQHAPTDYQLLQSMITAVNAAGKPAMVRVEGPHDRGGIQQALDLGAAGIMIPTVFSRADVEAAVSAMYYPDARHPTGSRSISWPIRPQLGRSVQQYLAAANDEVTLLVQIETKQAYDDIEAVLSVPGVDCAFVGPVDLSHALGLAQRLGFPGCFDSQEFQDALRRVLEVCKAKGVAAGNFAVTEAKAQELLGLGFSLLATGTDLGLLGDAAAKNAAFASKLRARRQ